MNTLTIAILVVCATAAYASAIPGAEVEVPGAVAEELFQGEESRHGYGGGGHHYGGGHHGGGHHGGGHHGGGHHGGGHHGGYGGYGK